jgi:hypothetical protein
MPVGALTALMVILDLGVYTAVGRTQANGDGTDSWCRSGDLVLTDMHYLNVYQEPVCDVPSALFADFNEYYEPYLLNFFDIHLSAGQFLCSEV